MATVGVVAGVAYRFALARLAGSYVENVQVPGAMPVVASAIVLPAARAARVTVVEAMRSE
jgi:hypothetical protein